MLHDDKTLDVTDASAAASPEFSKLENEGTSDSRDLQLPSATVARITRLSGVLNVLVAGIALFSDGYNAQIIGYSKSNTCFLTCSNHRLGQDG
jgi:hypothetical protein